MSGQDWRVSCEWRILTLTCPEPAISPTDLSPSKFLGLARKKNKCAAFRDVCVGATNMGTPVSAAAVDVSSEGWDLGAACLVSGRFTVFHQQWFSGFLMHFSLGYNYSRWPFPMNSLGFFSTLIQHNKTKHCVWFSNVNKSFKFTTNKTFFLGKKLLQINNETFLMTKSSQHLPLMSVDIAAIRSWTRGRKIRIGVKLTFFF